MIHFSLRDARIVPRWNSTKKAYEGYYIEHPQNDAIIASCDTAEEARIMVEGLNNFSEAMRRTSGVKIID